MYRPIQTSSDLQRKFPDKASPPGFCRTDRVRNEVIRCLLCWSNAVTQGLANGRAHRNQSNLFHGPVDAGPVSCCHPGDLRDRPSPRPPPAATRSVGGFASRSGYAAVSRMVIERTGRASSSSYETVLPFRVNPAARANQGYPNHPLRVLLSTLFRDLPLRKTI